MYFHISRSSFYCVAIFTFDTLKRTGRLKSGAVTGVGDQNFENKSLSVAYVFTIPGGGLDTQRVDLGLGACHNLHMTEIQSVM